MILPTEHAMMCLALDEAAKAAQRDEVPVGAVVYRDDQVIGSAHNLRQAQNDPTAHAEIIALRSAAKHLGRWNLSDCSIAVTLEPCPMCAGALINARIKRLVYGTRDPKMGCVYTLYQLPTDPRFNHRLEVTEGVLAGACSQILSDFFTKLRTAQ